MLSYIIRRSLYMIIILLAVSVVAFIIKLPHSEFDLVHTRHDLRGNSLELSWSGNSSSGS